MVLLANCPSAKKNEWKESEIKGRGEQRKKLENCYLSTTCFLGAGCIQKKNKFSEYTLKRAYGNPGFHKSAAVSHFRADVVKTSLQVGGKNK